MALCSGSWNGGEKCPGDPAESFCNCKLEQMNIAFVLPGRRDGAQAVGAFFKARRGGDILKKGLKSVSLALVSHDAWLEKKLWRGSFDLLSKAHTDLAGNPVRAPHSVCPVCTADYPDVKCKM